MGRSKRSSCPIWIPTEIGEMRTYEAELAMLLSEDDVTAVAEAIEPGSSAAVLVWENTWAAPFASAVRRSGGQLVASGRIPIQALLAAIEADEAKTMRTKQSPSRRAISSDSRKESDMPLARRRMRRGGVVGPHPVARTAATVGTVAVVAHGVNRRMTGATIVATTAGTVAIDRSSGSPMLTARFWRSRRAAAIAGIVFAVLLIAAMTMIRIALSEGSLQSLQSDSSRRTLIRISLQLVPFAGIAFLWFIGVVREQIGVVVEDRLFSTVFLGSGLLFLAMLFQGAVTTTSLMQMLAGPTVNAEIWTFGRGATRYSSPFTPCGWRRCSRCR